MQACFRYYQNLSERNKKAGELAAEADADKIRPECNICEITKSDGFVLLDIGWRDGEKWQCPICRPCHDKLLHDTELHSYE